MELYELRAGVDHFLPHEETDVRPCYEGYRVYGFGLGDVDLTNVPFIPFRMIGSPLGRTDLVLGSSFFRVMTPRLLHLLESLGDFPHQVIPAHLVPDRDDWQDHPPIDTTSFVVCNLHKHLHIIDFDRCELEPIEGVPEMSTIKRIALVDGVTVPPLFRQDDWYQPPLIPRSTRDAIVAAGLLDIDMPPVHGGVIRLSEIRTLE